MGLLTMWIFSTAVGIITFSVLFLWAVRSGQFREQERARHLPLEPPPDDDSPAAPACEEEGG